MKHTDRISINDRWYITIEKLQYVLWEVKKNDPDNPRTKNDTRDEPSYYTNLGNMLHHIAEHEPRTKHIDSFKDLLKAVEETNAILKRATEILKQEKVPYHANRELWESGV